MGADDSIPTYALLERLISSEEYTAILHVGDLGYDLHSDFGKVFCFLSHMFFCISVQKLKNKFT